MSSYCPTPREPFSNISDVPFVTALFLFMVCLILDDKFKDNGLETDTLQHVSEPADIVE